MVKKSSEEERKTKNTAVTANYFLDPIGPAGASKAAKVPLLQSHSLCETSSTPAIVSSCELRDPMVLAGIGPIYSIMCKKVKAIAFLHVVKK